MSEPGKSLEASKIGRLLKAILKEFWIEKKSFLQENCEKFLWRRSLAPKNLELNEKGVFGKTEKKL